MDTKLLDTEERKKYANLLYVAYPRKAGKADGLKKLLKMLKTFEDYATMANAVGNYDSIVKGQRREEKFILLFSTFVNGRWEDYTDENLGIERFNVADILQPAPTGFVKIKR